MRSGRTRRHGNVTGGFLGLLVFLVGIGMIVFTFQQAWALYNTPPAEALGIGKDKPITMEETGANAIGVVIRVLVLVAMAIIGSLLANRGVHLFADTRPRTNRPKDET